MIREYRYRCKDYSVLTPPFKKWIVEPVFKLVPRGIPANIITIISNLFIYASLFLAINRELLGQFNFLVIPLFIFIYLVGDHLDGMQAKNTGTGSALGEFCDHYLDAFNNGILLMVLFLLFDINNPYLVAAFISVSYIAHTVVFYEQFKTGWLIFEKIGSLEAVALTIFLLISAYFPSILQFYLSEAYFGLTIMELVMIGSTLGAVGTLIKTLGRIESVTYAFWLFIITVLSVSFLAASLYSSFTVFVIITLYGSVYIGKLMQGHLLDGIERSPGLFTPTLLAILYLTDFSAWTDFRIVIGLYLMGSIAMLVYKTFKPLSQYWVWWNPKTEQIR